MCGEVTRSSVTCCVRYSSTRYAVNTYWSQAGEYSIRQLRLRTRLWRKNGISFYQSNIVLQSYWTAILNVTLFNEFCRTAQYRGLWTSLVYGQSPDRGVWAHGESPRSWNAFLVIWCFLRCLLATHHTFIIRQLELKLGHWFPLWPCSVHYECRMVLFIHYKIVQNVQIQSKENSYRIKWL